MSLLRLIRWLCVLMLLAVAVAAARVADNTPQAMVRAHLEPSGSVVAGSQIKLVVDCLTTSWFTEAPDWPLFDVPGAIVSLPDEQAENLHEVINGVDWFGVSRAYRIVPQTAQAFVIHSFAITVQPGQMSGPVKLMTPELKFAATVPAGAEGMRIFFPTQKLVATQQIRPSPAHAKVGDEITRTVTQRATGTQSMFIPPLDFPEVAGLKRYPGNATTRDVVEDRAGLVAGERTDTATYRIEHGGKLRLPALTIEWWNTAARRKETIVLPEVTISAVAATEKPIFAIPVNSLGNGAAHRIIVVDREQIVIAGLIVALLSALVWAYPRLVRFYQSARRYTREVQRRHADGAAPAWRALRRATREGVPQHIVPALYRWMDKSGEFGHPARIDGSEGLEPLANVINSHYSNGVMGEVQWTAVERALRRTTKRARKQRKKQSSLPPLNRY